MHQLLFYLLSVFFGLFLQLIGSLNFSEYSPNFLLLLVIFFALRYGPMSGEVIGFVAGMLFDVFSLSPFGSQAFLLTLVGYGLGRQSGKVDEKNVFAQVMVVFLVSVVYITSMTLLQLIFFLEKMEIINFGRSILYVVINVAVAPVFFYILNKWSRLWGDFYVGR